MRYKTIIGLALAVMTAPAAAQSASATLSGPTSAAPGDTISVTLVIDHDTNGAGSGVFGASGLYGLGGSLLASGVDASASAVEIDPAFTLGPVASVGTSPSLATVAGGRGLSGGLAATTFNVAALDLTIDPASSEASITIDFDGAVVLVEGDALVTFSTDPGLNQSFLTVNSLTIALTEPCPADVNGDGTTTADDITFVVSNLGAGSPGATGTPGDANADGVTTTGDITFVVSNLDCGA